VDRRRFEHLLIEISLACRQSLPRYRLWLALHHSDANPEDLSREHAIDFCNEDLADFLAEQGMSLSLWRRRKVRRAVKYYDPLLPTPEDRLSHLEDLDEPEL
jgi:hypothetical protein